MTDTDLEATVIRHFIIKCDVNKGGKHMIPLTVSEVRKPSHDPMCDYDIISESPHLGELRTPMEHRGYLTYTKNGSPRFIREQRIGKRSWITKDRRGITYVGVTIPVKEWHLFTKRTDEPKLSWLLEQCHAKGLRVVQKGHSAHAPCTYVHRDDYDSAWDVLSPVDNIPDDDCQFAHTI